MPFQPSRDVPARPPAGTFVAAEDVNRRAGGGAHNPPTGVPSPPPTPLPPSFPLNGAIEGLALPRRVGAVFLPSTSGATNGRFFQPQSLVHTPGYRPLSPPPHLPGESWLRPRRSSPARLDPLSQAVGFQWPNRRFGLELRLCIFAQRCSAACSLIKY